MSKFVPARPKGFNDHLVDRTSAKRLNDSPKQCFSNFRQSRTTSQAVGAQADDLRKIPYTQKSMQVKRKNIIPAVKVTKNTFLDTNLKLF
jgi:hypothetical protein